MNKKYDSILLLVRFESSLILCFYPISCKSWFTWTNYRRVIALLKWYMFSIMLNKLPSIHFIFEISSVLWVWKVNPIRLLFDTETQQKPQEPPQRWWIKWTTKTQCPFRWMQFALGRHRSSSAVVLGDSEGVGDILEGLVTWPFGQSLSRN